MIDPRLADAAGDAGAVPGAGSLDESPQAAAPSAAAAKARAQSVVRSLAAVALMRRSSVLGPVRQFSCS